MSLSEKLAAGAAGIVMLLFHAMWIGAVLRDFWRWKMRMEFWLGVGALLAVDTFLTGVILAVMGK